MKNDNLNSTEQQIEELLSIIGKLNSDNQKLLYDMCLKLHNKSLRERLGYSTVICDKASFELMNYIREERAAKRDELLLFLDVFAYGVIHGIRKERARRANREEPSGILYP